MVRPRESLVSIARRHGTTVASLRQLNGLKKAVAPRGARLLIRPANSQTLLTTESGDRRVVAQSEARIIRAVVRETSPAAPAANAVAPAPAAKAPVRAVSRKASRPVAQPKAAARNSGSGAKTPVARKGSGKRT